MNKLTTEEETYLTQIMTYVDKEIKSIPQAVIKLPTKNRHCKRNIEPSKARQPKAVFSKPL